MMAARKRKTLGDQIRELVESSEHSRYAICKATGIDKGAMSHFIAGHRGLSLESLDALGNFLNLQVVHKPKERR